MASLIGKISKNPLGMGGLLVIAGAVCLAVLAYHLAPDKTPLANRMSLALSNKAPGFSMQFIKVPRSVSSGQNSRNFWQQMLHGKPDTYEYIPIQHYSLQGDSLRYTLYRGEAAGLTQSMALEQWHSQSFSENEHLGHRTYWLGTDKYGRDVLSRILLGTRISLAVGMVSVFISLIIGIPLGLLAGYFGGKLDELIMWIINVIWSIPGLLMVIAITLALGKGFYQVFIAIGFTMWVEVARVTRGQVLSVKQREYVQAARVLGFSDFRIMFKHILPNVVAPLIVISAANFAAAILIESGLSFLGIGAQPPMPSWGGMIKDHYAYLVVGKAYLAIAPGVAIMTLVLAFMMLGNALRDALDVRRF